MSLSKQSKMLNYINYRMRVTIQDSRTLVGTFMAFDKHMNLVLGDCEEYRAVKKRGSGPANGGKQDASTSVPAFARGNEFVKRSLGLVLLRGEQVISLTVEGPPPSSGARARIAGMGPGAGRVAGRGMVPGMGMPGMGMGMPGMGGPAPGLAGPIQGLGGPAGNMMMPMGTVSAPPMAGRGRGLPPPMPGYGRGR